MTSTIPTSELDAAIERATSESIPNGELNLPVALEISDILRSRRVPPKDGMRCLKKRISNTSHNPNTQLASWKLVEICMKNGGIPFLREVCSREFMDTMEHTILKYDDNEDVEELVIRLLYELYLAFENDSQLNYVSRVYDKLRQRGVKFPEGMSSSLNTSAMFDSKTPADWVDSDACMICSKGFSLLNRRHHCRSCGGTFCQEHSSKNIPLPDLGIYDEVRVCDNCYDDYDFKRGSSSGGHKKKDKKRKGRRHHGREEDDEDLRRAIELSLKASQSSVEPVIPVVENDYQPKQREQASTEEDDPELRAAIEASLREAEDEKRRREQKEQQSREALNTFSAPTHELSAADEEDIYLFASLVERMKNRPPSELLEDTQLQQLAQKVFASKPRLGNTLNNKIQKYNTLVDMNGKISNIMNVYDNLLEQELNNINLSERFTISQPNVYSSYTIPQAPAAQQYETSQYEQVQQHVSQSKQTPQQVYYAPPQNNTVTDANHIEQNSHPVRMSEPSVISAPAEQQLDIEEKHRKDLSDITTPPTKINQSSNYSIPSEPPYPDEEMSDITSIQLNSQKPNLYDNREDGNTGVPYPLDNEENRNTDGKEGKITHYDFPSVPARKLPEGARAEQEQEEQEIEQQNSSKQEDLLIEL
ncbi:Vacuolar protein sorting-associated protein 27 [Nakaseomyces bracarensis]|uniref:Vacuolar protein sorting-associated protein 27 n=1 Tax=Nakaseomyces bracarensis TaxID=273131 RepID=A0ABR4NR06_9SACH